MWSWCWCFFFDDGDDYDADDALYIDDVDDADIHVDADDEGDDALHLEAPAATAGFLNHWLVMRLLSVVHSVQQDQS